MGKEEKNNKEAANKIPTQNGVIISVYVESPKTQSPQRTVADVKKTKPKKSVSKKHQAARKRGYDRRAHLLAYARDLRNVGPQEVQRPRNNMRSMPKVIEFFQYNTAKCAYMHACTYQIVMPCAEKMEMVDETSEFLHSVAPDARAHQ
jgi:hypothetical protein